MDCDEMEEIQDLRKGSFLSLWNFKSRFIAALICSVAFFGMCNSFSSRIRAEAFGSANYIVAVYDSILQWLIYVVAYFWLVSRGSIPRGELKALCRGKGGWHWSDLPLVKYLLISAICDVADQVTGFSAEPHLTTLTYSLMNQATVPFTVLISIIFLGTRYSIVELVSVLVVMAGAIGCVYISRSQSDDSEQDSASWAIFAACTTSFTALSYILKEITFRNYPTLNENNEPPALSFVTVTIIVNTISLITCLPIVMLDKFYTESTSSDHIPSIGEAMSCMFTCEHAGVAFLAYAAFNMAWNASLLLLTAQGSALLTFLALKLQVPMIALLSAVPWPLIGSNPVSPIQLGMLGIMACGIVGYQWAQSRRKARKVEMETKFYKQIQYS